MVIIVSKISNEINLRGWNTPNLNKKYKKIEFSLFSLFLTSNKYIRSYYS